jgi:hypothetical protein
MRVLDRKRACIALFFGFLGLRALGAFAYADWVPESIRIQKEAEKSYRTAPIVPIVRPSPHRREFLRDGPAGFQIGPAPSPGTGISGTGKRASDR